MAINNRSKRVLTACEYDARDSYQPLTCKRKQWCFQRTPTNAA
jgi:hypothetical protein